MARNVLEKCVIFKERLDASILQNLDILPRL
jgi:hypothetical protein